VVSVVKIPTRRKRLSEAAIYRFINRCRREMKLCEASKAYLAGIVLSGAALEYILTAWVRAFEIANGRRNLKELVATAYKHGLLDRKAFCAAERIRKFRNLVHPNWFAGAKPIRFTTHLLDARLADFNVIVDSIKRYYV
jgi:hypothetical protein